jgi:ubiquinone/menaquinone biosynthesis C-methylase UbiE
MVREMNKKDIEAIAMKLFNESADSYGDFAPEWIRNHYCKKRSIYLSKFLIKNSRVLDVGCGDGNQLISICDSNIKEVGIDFSKKMITKANEKAKYASGRFEFIIGNSKNLPFENNTFDLVYSVNTFHHISILGYAKIRKVLEEMVRVTTPKGYTVVIDVNGRNPYWKLLLSSNKFDTGKEKAVPVELIIKYLRSMGMKRINKSYSGFIPDFCSGSLFPTMVRTERFVERSFLAPVICSHFFISSMKYK